MQAFQERVVAEKSELDAKIEKLHAFFETSTFAGLSNCDRRLLSDQIHLMRQYSIILAQRIERFK